MSTKQGGKKKHVVPAESMNSPQGKWPKKGWQIQVHFGRKCAFLASLNQHPSTQKRSKNVFSHVSFFCPWSKPSPALRHPLSIRAIVNGIPLTKKCACPYGLPWSKMAAPFRNFPAFPASWGPGPLPPAPLWPERASAQFTASKVSFPAVPVPSLGGRQQQLALGKRQHKKKTKTITAYLMALTQEKLGPTAWGSTWGGR